LLDDGSLLVADSYDDGDVKERSLTVSEIGTDDNGQPFRILTMYLDKGDGIVQNFSTSRDEQMWPADRQEMIIESHIDAALVKSVEEYVHAKYGQLRSRQLADETNTRLTYLSEPELTRI